MKESSLGCSFPRKIQSPHSWEMPSDESQVLIGLNPVSPPLVGDKKDSEVLVMTG